MVGSVPSVPLVHAPAGRRSNTVVDILARLAQMLQVRRERRQLAALDDTILKDLGLSRGDVERETQRWSWDLPARRK